MRAIRLDHEEKSQGTLWQLTFDATMPLALRHELASSTDPSGLPSSRLLRNAQHHVG